MKTPYNKPKRPKAIWTQLAKKKPVAVKPKRISAISVSRKEALKEYAKVRREYLKTHPICEGFEYKSDPKMPGHWLKSWPCTADSQDIHHVFGRLGPLLCDVRFFKAVCRRTHTDIENHKDWARSVGLLCAKGDWNKIPSP